MGVGPVDALANVLKKSLARLFPDVPNVRLLDFEVQLIQGTIGTSAQVEVRIVFSDGNFAWRVSASSDNINEASFRALLDGYEYAIYLWGKERVQSPKSKVQRKAQSPKAKGKTNAQSPKAKEKAKSQSSKSKAKTTSKK